MIENISYPTNEVELDKGLGHAFEDGLYPNGWVLAEKGEIPLPPAFQRLFVRTEFLGKTLLIRKDADYVKRGSIVVIGHIFHLEKPLCGLEETVEFLSLAVAQSEDRLLSELEVCNGNFVLFYIQQEELIILTDATGMSSVFYDEQYMLAGSNASLLASVLSSGLTVRVIDIPHKFGFPGNFTPFVGVKALNPGCCLVLGHGVVRYQLLRAPPALEYNEVLDEFFFLLRTSFTAFGSRRNLLMSLTAGLDSRSALVGSSSLNKAKYFTYYRDDGVDTDAADVCIASYIARKLGLDHRIVNLRKVGVPAEYAVVCRLNSHYRHIISASYNYYRLWKGADLFHVRSNLAEIGRSFYSFKLRTDRPVSPSVKNALRFYVGDKIRRDESYSERLEEIYRAMMSVYLDESRFVDVDTSYDFRDVFYWEHRMGMWHSQVVAESNAAFDSLSAYNCPRILKLMLMVSLEGRREKRLFRDLLKQHCPELYSVPINPGREVLEGFRRRVSLGYI